MAAECVDIANRMSLHRDRERLMQMAERWLRMAADVDAPDLAVVSSARPDRRGVSPSAEPGAD
jgi:hypothetical protein